MQLTIKDHNQFGTLTILSIDLSGETEQELLKLEHDLAIGRINQNRRGKPMRYQVIGKSGKVYGTFATKPLAYQFINNTYPTYKYAYRDDGGQKESLIAQVLPDIMSVVPAKRLKPTEPKAKSDWELLIELTLASGEDTDEIRQLRKKLLKKSSDKIKTEAKGRNNGQEVFAKLENGNALSFSTYTQAGDYFGVAASSISARVYEGTVTRTGKIKGISFYIEE